MSLSIWQKIKLANLASKTFKNIPTPIKMNSSWKTTIFGAGGLLTVITFAANALFDGDPATNPDWAVTITAILTGIGLIFAKDSAAK